MRSCFRFFTASVVAIGAVSIVDGRSGRAAAAETTVQNDSLQPGQTGAIQAGFDPGESAAVWLTSPCDGRIVAVQVFWRSLSGGTPQSVEDSITIHEEGVFPVPGAVLETLLAPVMNDGFLNEFRHLDEEQTVPLDVPVTQGQVFVVSFKFFNNPNPLNGPSVVTDIGCQAGKNAIDANGLGWVSSCALGVSGDFVIRAVVDCDEPTGACCLVTGDCVEGGTASDCIAAGGVFQGPGSNCMGVSCPILVGACCMTDGSCQDGLTESQCLAAGGTYQGDASNCTDVTCPQPGEACCNPASGFCSLLDPNVCSMIGGVPQGPGTTCVGPSADQCPTGACCLPDGTCMSGATPAECAAAAGTYQGNGSACGAVMCPQPQGACCLMAGGCSILGQAVCEGFGNTWMGIGTDCSDADMNGTADVCETCPGPDGNMNGDASVDGGDLQEFVRAVTSLSTQPDDVCHGDFSTNGVVDEADIGGMTAALLGS